MGELVAISGIVTGMVFIWTIGSIIKAAINRSGHRPRAELSPAMQDRFDRMEQAIDAIAVEVERISEGQRFATKLLAERYVPSERSAAGQPEPQRSTTPV